MKLQTAKKIGNVVFWTLFGLGALFGFMGIITYTPFDSVESLDELGYWYLDIENTVFGLRTGWLILVWAIGGRFLSPHVAKVITWKE